MKKLSRFCSLGLCWLAVLVLCLMALTQPRSARAQGTAFTYQGRLVDGPGSATGTYDFQFTLYDSPVNGTVVGGPVTNAATSVVAGLFTVTIDFGNNPFSAGAPRWLEIQVRTNGSGSFGTINPRAALTATPYAITAGTLTGPLGPASLAGAYSNAVTFANPANQFSGNFTGNGSGLSNVNAAALGGLVASNFWQTSGNGGLSPSANFLGTTDNQPLEFRVNGQRVLRFTPNANGGANLLGGSIANSIAPGVVGGTTIGGGSISYFGSPYSNSLGSDFGFVGGGGGNTIATNALFSAIVGGSLNQIQANSQYAFIGGGTDNQIQNAAGFSTISGGGGNQIGTNSQEATIGGGGANIIGANQNEVTIGGGGGNRILDGSPGSTIAGGSNNQIQTNSSSAIADGLINQIQSFSDYSFIGGGNWNIILPNSQYAMIAGGNFNSIQTAASYSSIAGGSSNTNAGYIANIGGGEANFIQFAADHAVIAGGGNNTIVGSFTLPVYDTIGGGQGNVMQTNSIYAVIGGGRSNVVTAGAAFSTISGGTGNTIFLGAVNATIGGGSNNVADANGATVVGGLGNSALSPGSLAMGIASMAHGFASIAMGQNTTATGNNSLAAGVGAQATNHGAFVWADQTDFGFSSTNDNSFNVHAVGGVRFVTSGAGMSLDGPLGVTSGTISGNGGLLTNINASTLGGIASSNFWKLGGNLGANPANGAFVGTLDFQPLELHINNQRALRLEPLPEDGFHSNAVNVVLGSPANYVSNGVYGATIAGGGAVYYLGPATNRVIGDFGTVGGGFNNTSGDQATVGGGHFNTSTGAASTVAGGYFNTASGYESTVGGGSGNQSSGSGSTIPGGLNNTAAGNYSFAAGFLARALHDGAFVWADSLPSSVFSSSGSNQFLIRASGGVGIGKTNPATALDVNGTITATAFSGSGTGLSGVALLSGGNALSGNQTINSGNLGIGTLSPASPVHVNTSVGVDSAVRLTSGGSWPLVFNQSPSSIFSITNGGDARLAILPNGNVGIGTTSPTNKLHVAGGVSAIAFINTSDRNAKENFAPISPAEVLEKVTALPITTWNFKEMPGARHMGPMAQDFYAAFGLGGSDTTITTVDPDGVALAAIQGLSLKLQQTEQELQDLKTQNHIQATALRQLTAQVQELLDSRAIESHP